MNKKLNDETTTLKYMGEYPAVKYFFDPATFTLTYVVYDLKSKDAVIIDPVWDYDPASSTLTDRSVQLVLDFVKQMNLNVHLILETHAHADHISGAQVIKKNIKAAKVGIGADIGLVQEVFRDFFNLGSKFKIDGSQFDVLLKESHPIQAGSLTIQTISTPGHTPACSSYLIGNALFVGDTIFMPDYGTGRCDFPAGSADELYRSIKQKIYNLPDQTRIFVGHDYLPEGRELRFETSVQEEKGSNIQLSAETDQADFIKMRKGRDKTLSAPRLLLPSVYVNINGGNLYDPEDNGKSYLKIPVKIT